MKEKGQIGVVITTGASGLKIAPPADKEYAVEPVGVQISNPSPRRTLLPSPTSIFKVSI